MGEPLTHSKLGTYCKFILPDHEPLDGEGFGGSQTCASHFEHVDLGLPHVCCCGFEVPVNDGDPS